MANESDRAVPTAQAGLFANAVLQACPALPVEDERRMRNPKVQKHFFARVLAQHLEFDGADSGPGPDAFAALVGAQA